LRGVFDVRGLSKASVDQTVDQTEAA
jgi:hypothetical protein